jgi:hypothetical protein
MAEIMPQKTRGDHAFCLSQQTFGAVINRPADGFLPPFSDGASVPLTSAPSALSTPPPSASAVPAVPPLMLPLPPSLIGALHSWQQHGPTLSYSNHQLPESESPLNKHGRFQLADDDDDDDDDDVPVMPPSTPPPPPDSAASSISQLQSQASTATSSSKSKRKYSAQMDQLSISSAGKKQRVAGGTVALHTLSQGVKTFNAQFGAFMNAASQAREDCQKGSRCYTR